MATPRPPPTRPGPRSAAADSHAGSDAAAAGPESAAHLVDPVERTPTEPTDYAALTAIYGALLAGTAVSARGRDPIPTGELPALAAASFALSKLVVHEKVESWVRRPFVDERRPQAQGPAAALRRRRAAHVHALHGRVERARAGGPAVALAGRRADRRRGARRERRERSVAGELHVPVRTRERRPSGAPAPPRAVTSARAA